MDFHTLLVEISSSSARRTRSPPHDQRRHGRRPRSSPNVEGIDEILNDASKLESPKKAEAGSPELPRTASRRASARRAPAAEEPKGTQGSPLPRSRRVTAKALEIMQLVDGDGVENEGKQEGKKEMPKTPAAALRSSRKPQGTAGRRAAKKGESGAEEIVGETPAAAAASGARTTRRRTSKKAEQEGVHEAAVEVPSRLRPLAAGGGRLLERPPQWKKMRRKRKRRRHPDYCKENEADREEGDGECCGIYCRKKGDESHGRSQDGGVGSGRRRR
uniref:Uncharacterized protein n=1 Tax=Ananas comosus var. bracteatus TaxID=296719 RepID=A0A6V7QQ50_ANACO|nr:unnamed protein product [Ananas comosus var. bracteatus]